MHTLLLGSLLGMTAAGAGREPDHLLRRARAALDSALRPLRLPPLAAGSLESGLKYLIVGSIGSATLLYGLAFIYGGSGAHRLHRDRRRDRHRPRRRSADLDRDRPRAVGLAFKVSIAPFHQWTPDVYEGAPTPITGVHGRRDQGGRVRGLRSLLHHRARPLGGSVAAGARRARRDHDHRRQRRRDRPELAEADARLLRRRPGRLHARRAARRHSPESTRCSSISPPTR